jgi:hypothetical protein
MEGIPKNIGEANPKCFSIKNIFAINLFWNLAQFV